MSRHSAADYIVLRSLRYVSDADRRHIATAIEDARVSVYQFVTKAGMGSTRMTMAESHFSWFENVY